MILPHDPITPAAFLAAAAAAARALNQPVTNAAEAHELAKAEALVLDRFDSSRFDLAEAVALQAEVEHLAGHLQFRQGVADVCLDFDALVALVQCEATARQGALRAGFWPRQSGGRQIWGNFQEAADGHVALSPLQIPFHEWSWPRVAPQKGKAGLR